MVKPDLSISSKTLIGLAPVVKDGHSRYLAENWNTLMHAINGNTELSDRLSSLYGAYREVHNNEPASNLVLLPVPTFNRLVGVDLPAFTEMSSARDRRIEKTQSYQIKLNKCSKYYTSEFANPQDIAETRLIEGLCNQRFDYSACFAQYSIIRAFLLSNLERRILDYTGPYPFICQLPDTVDFIAHSVGFRVRRLFVSISQFADFVSGSLVDQNGEHVMIDLSTTISFQGITCIQDYIPIMLTVFNVRLRDDILRYTWRLDGPHVVGLQGPWPEDGDVVAAMRAYYPQRAIQWFRSGLQTYQDYILLVQTCPDYVNLADLTPAEFQAATQAGGKGILFSLDTALLGYGVGEVAPPDVLPIYTAVVVDIISRAVGPLMIPPTFEDVPATYQPSILYPDVGNLVLNNQNMNLTTQLGDAALGCLAAHMSPDLLTYFGGYRNDNYRPPLPWFACGTHLNWLREAGLITFFDNSRPDEGTIAKVSPAQLAHYDAIISLVEERSCLLTEDLDSIKSGDDAFSNVYGNSAAFRAASAFTSGPAGAMFQGNFHDTGARFRTIWVTRTPGAADFFKSKVLYREGCAYKFAFYFDCIQGCNIDDITLLRNYSIALKQLGQYSTRFCDLTRQDVYLEVPIPVRSGENWGLESAFLVPRTQNLRGASVLRPFFDFMQALNLQTPGTTYTTYTSLPNTLPCHPRRQLLKIRADRLW